MHGGLRRHDRLHGPGHRPDRRVASADGPTGQHADPVPAGQRRQLRGHRPTGHRNAGGRRPACRRRGPEFIETQVTPKRTRDGWPVLQGTGVMPGPPDTYIAYGRDWANVSNTPFREYKHFVHEGGIASPLIAHWPAHIIRAGELERQPAHLIDLMATCVDLSGATYPKEFAGHPVRADGRSQPAAGVQWQADRAGCDLLGARGESGDAGGEMEAGCQRSRRHVGVVRHGRRPHGDARPGQFRAGPDARHDSQMGSLGEAGARDPVDVEAAVR